MFGTNNVNYVRLESCDINRFDIHCYGRDVFCKGTVFRDLYNQFSSLYGHLTFTGCTFVKFVPVLFEDSYSAYTHFDLTFEDCKIIVDAKRPYLIHAGTPGVLAESPRAGMQQVSWPDVKLNNVTVVCPDNPKEWCLFTFSGDKTPVIHGMNNIEINNLIFSGSVQVPDVKLGNKKIITQQPIAIKVTMSSIEDIKRE